jgi:hypothetical protein
VLLSTNLPRGVFRGGALKIVARLPARQVIRGYFFFEVDFFDEEDFFEEDDFFADEVFFEDDEEDFFEEPFFEDDEEAFFDDPFFEEPFFEDEDFFAVGTLPPSARASDRPIAMACLRLVTFLPEPPLLSVPRLRSCIAFSTFSDALFPYFDAMQNLLHNGLCKWRALPSCGVGVLSVE